MNKKNEQFLISKHTSVFVYLPLNNYLRTPLLSKLKPTCISPCFVMIKKKKTEKKYIHDDHKKMFTNIVSLVPVVSVNVTNWFQGPPHDNILTAIKNLKIFSFFF